MSSHHKQFSSPDELLDQLGPSWPQSTRLLPPSSPPRKSLYFLVVFDFEEIPISDAELQDSILAKQTFVCDGRMKTSGMPNVPKHTPGQWSLSYENCSPNLKVKGRVGGHEQFSSPEELLDQLVPSWPSSTRPHPLLSFFSSAEILLIQNLQVHVIHKLTKDISMLRKKKTKNEADKSKNERKVARFVQEVQVMSFKCIRECFYNDIWTI